MLIQIVIWYLLLIILEGVHSIQVRPIFIKQIHSICVFEFYRIETNPCSSILFIIINLYLIFFSRQFALKRLKFVKIQVISIYLPLFEPNITVL